MNCDSDTIVTYVAGRAKSREFGALSVSRDALWYTAEAVYHYRIAGFELSREQLDRALVEVLRGHQACA